MEASLNARSDGACAGLQADAYARLYGVLARIFISELDATAVRALCHPDIASVLETLHPGYEAYMQAGEWDEARLEALASDYCHLFILPQETGLSLLASHWMRNKDSPCSHWSEGLERYKNTVTDIPDSIHRLPNDHLGVVLAFVGALYASEDIELQKLAPVASAELLGPWIPKFVEKLGAMEANPIYSASGKLLLNVLNVSASR